MATIELEAKHNPLAWMLYMTKLQVVIDGQASTSGWGKQEFQVAPGNHTVGISFGYFGSQRGPAETTVAVEEGTPARLRYRMPSWMFAKGKLKTV